MNEPTRQRWEQVIQETAAMLIYPPTPHIAGRVRERLTAMQKVGSRQSAVGSGQWAVSSKQLAVGGRPSAVGRRRLAWVVALVLALLVGSLLFVPEMRAALLRVLQIGPIRVFVDETLAEPTVTPTSPVPTGTPTADVSPTPTLPVHSLALAQLGEPVTLAEAQEQVTFPIILPGYPEELGEPDGAYLHISGNVTAVTLVWFRPEQPEQVWFSLSQIPLSEFEFALKWARQEDVIEFYMNGQRAVWIKGPHRIQLVNPESVSPMMMTSNVLIWTDGDMTYRLEGNIEMDEATRIAESLE